MEINVVLAVGVASLAIGFVLCLKAIISCRGVYAARGAMLLAIGGATLWVQCPRIAWTEGFHFTGGKLPAARRERAEVEHSLHRRVLPLLARCRAELNALKQNPPGSDAEEFRRRVEEKEHINSVFNDTQARLHEHEKALAELNVAIASLEREQELTQVKDVSRARAIARVTFKEVRSKIHDAP